MLDIEMETSVSHFPVISESLHRELHDNLLCRWYPLVIDKKHGGYFTNVAHDWQVMPEQEKMIVSQARHLWTTSRAAMFEPGGSSYEAYALHGLHFLRDFMWDKQYGGFYQIRSREGSYSDCRGWGEEKRSLGNAVALLALASLYNLTQDHTTLAFAKKSFEWMEAHAYDVEYKGYHQYLTRQGEPFDEASQYRSVASDMRGVGLKDYNSTIHLLEAYTELLRNWNKDALRGKLMGILELIRDTMVTRHGYLQLYFSRDWTPVTFRNSSEATRTLNYGLDHVSFGVDLETAFFMLDASYTLGLTNDSRTLAVAKTMVDHAIEYGWDKDLGGVFDAGYYLNGSGHCSIIRNTKTWWAQAEALNTLLVFSCIFPEDTRYSEIFEKQWFYIDKYLLDRRNGDWYERGLDTDPLARSGPKSHMWKCTYHTARALMNCIALTCEEENCFAGILKHHHQLSKMIDHWKKTRLNARRTEMSAVSASSRHNGEFESDA